VRPFSSKPDLAQEGSLVLISSRPSTPEGCREARADVVKFTELLAKKDLRGTLVVVETSIRKDSSNLFGVALAVSSGAKAGRRAVSIVQQAARSSSDDKTGVDAFLIRSQEWKASGKCYARRKLG
jgi:hypothetical protein